MKLVAPAKRDLKLYRSGGGLFPSVTEVLRSIPAPHYDHWRKRVGYAEADHVQRSATTLGTHVHTMAQGAAIGHTGVTAEPMQPFMDAICDFLERHVEKAIHTELELVSVKMKYGGTLDLYARLKDGSLAVVDYKTSSSLTRKDGLQLAAYALLLRENGYKVNKRLCVRIKKEKPGAYAVRQYDQHREDVEAWLALLKVWHWQHAKTLARRTKTMKGAER